MGSIGSWLLVIIFGPIVIVYGIYLWQKRRQKLREVDRSLTILKKYDPIWNKEGMTEFVKERFIKIQNAISDDNRTELKSHLTTDLYKEWEVKLDKMKKTGQRYITEPLDIKKISFVDVEDYTDDTMDRFTVTIIASARRYTVDEHGRWAEPEWDENVDPNKEMVSKPFSEVWTFQRHDDTWKLMKIDKGSEVWEYIDSETVLEDEKYRHLMNAE